MGTLPAFMTGMKLEEHLLILNIITKMDYTRLSRTINSTHVSRIPGQLLQSRFNGKSFRITAALQRLQIEAQDVPQEEGGIRLGLWFFGPNDEPSMLTVWWEIMTIMRNFILLFPAN